MGLEGMQLSEHLASVAGNQTAGSPTAELLRGFRICGKCQEFKRLGEQHDGGYLTCMDGLSSAGLRAAFSLGVEHHDNWSDDAAQVLGVPVNQFDCTVGQGTGCKDCKFFQKCIVGEGKDKGLDLARISPGLSKSTDKGWTLREALAGAGQEDAPDRSLIMKVDIEASEWPLFATTSPGMLKKFKQLIVEFHGLRVLARHKEYLDALRHILTAGFQVVHIHGNNFAGLYEDGGSKIPDVLEVTFAAGAEARGNCLRDQEYLKYQLQRYGPNHDHSIHLFL